MTTTPGRYEHMAAALREPDNVVELVLRGRFARVPEEVRRFANLAVLEMPAAGLEHLPDWLVELPRLSVLRVSSNRFTKVPAVLARMPALREINLAGNPLERLDGIGALRQLRALSLGNNPAGTLALSPDLFELTELESLWLHAFRDTEVPKELARLTGLTKLTLAAGAFEDLPGELEALTALEEANLQWGRLTRVPAVLARLPKLRTLGLASNGQLRLDAGGLTALALESLDLTECPQAAAGFPADPGRLAALRTLSLAECALTSVPRGLFALTALESLTLAKNQLTDLPSDAAAWTRLESLRLRSNKLTTIPAVVGSLTGLRTLALDDNPLTELPGAVLAKLTNLRSLAVVGGRDSPLAALPPELGAMASLEELEVRSHKALTQLPGDLSGLRSLRKLDLLGCALSTLPGSLGTLHALEVLDVRLNQLTQLPASMVALRKLARLDVGYNPLGDAANRVLASLRALRTLNLEGTRPTSVFAGLWSLTELEELTLGDLPYETPAAPLPAGIGALTKLRTLVLGRGISALPDEFERLTALEQLTWSSAKIQSFPRVLCQLMALRKLALREADLGPLPDDLGNLTHLEELSLVGCKVSALSTSLGAMTSLQKLSVQENPIGALPDSIGALRWLEILEASRCALRALPDTLGRCEHLRCAYFDDNQLTTLPDSFANLHALAHLWLGQNALHALPPGLAALRNLESLRLTGNEFPPAEMAALEAFAKRQYRAHLNLDKPRLGKARTLRKPAAKRLAKKVVLQIERLGGAFTDRPAPAEPVKVSIGGTDYVLPEAIRQLIQDVTWPAGEFQGTLGGMDLRIACLRATLQGGLLDEYECVKNDAYIELGHTNQYCILALRFAGNKAPDDPTIHYVDHDSFSETEATDYNISLATFLARLSAVPAAS